MSKKKEKSESLKEFQEYEIYEDKNKNIIESGKEIANIQRRIFLSLS